MDNIQFIMDQTWIYEHSPVMETRDIIHIY